MLGSSELNERVERGSHDSVGAMGTGCLVWAGSPRIADADLSKADLVSWDQAGLKRRGLVSGSG